MPERIADEDRREIIGRMFLSRNAAKVSQETGFGESTVRNVMKELDAGLYPEYALYLPRIDAISRLNKDLEATGISVGEAGVGLTIYAALRELGIDPRELPDIVKTLRRIAGDTRPAEFGRAVQQLSKLQAETGLNFRDLESRVLTKRSEYEALQDQCKDATEERDSRKAMAAEAQGSLDRTLEQTGVTKQFLENYIADKRELTAADLGFGDVKALADFIRVAKAEGFLETSKELARVEAETGMNYDTLVKEYQRTRIAAEAGRQEEKHLNNEIYESKSKIVDLKRQEAEQLAQNGITKEKLNRHLGIVDRLSKAGIDFEKLERLRPLLDNFEKLGYDPDRIVQSLSRIVDLDDEARKAESHLAEVKSQCAQEEERYAHLQKRTSIAETNLGNITQTFAKAQLNLNDVLKTAKDKSDQIEFAESIRLLFQDPSQMILGALVELIVQLQRILEAKLNLAIYPIDYAQAREKALSLLEQALGKSLVRREVFDEILQRTTEKHDDLMFDRLGKMERERTRLANEEAKVATMKQGAEQATEEKVLHAALNMHTKGQIKIYRCRKCGRAMAHTVAGSHSNLTACPFCSANSA
jgi:hypothetical protein